MSGSADADGRCFSFLESRQADLSFQRQLNPIGERAIKLPKCVSFRTARSQEAAKTGDAGCVPLIPTQVFHYRKLHRVAAVFGQIVHEQSISTNDTSFKPALGGSSDARFGFRTTATALRSLTRVRQSGRRPPSAAPLSRCARTLRPTTIGIRSATVLIRRVRRLFE